MINTTYLVLLILLIIYIPTFIFVKKSEKAKAMGLVTSGPIIMIKTKVGIKLMDRLCVYRRFWRVMGIFSRFVTLFLMVFIVSIIVIDLLAIPRMTSTGGLGIEYALAIPGLNPMLPLIYGWIALIIAMVVHEFAHGVQTRANDMEVESTGILHCVVPLGAFVEPNEEQVEKCSRKARLDLYAAGITTNFILAVVTFLLLFGGMTGGITSDYEDNPAIYAISGSSPGFDSGIPTSAIIVKIDGTAISSIDSLYEKVTMCKEYDLGYIHVDTSEIKHVTLRLGAFIEGTVKGSPAEKFDYLQKGYFLTAVENNATGDKHTIGTPSDFTKFMKDTKPGELYNFYTINAAGDVFVSPVTLSEKNGIGYAGISTSFSGLSFITPNKLIQKSIDPFYGCDTISQKAMGMLSYVGGALNGFSPVPESTHWWYQSTAVSDDVFWILMTLFYWIFWLNIVLAITNAIPAIPFDGGFMFIGGLDFILEKSGMRDEERRDKVVGSVTRVISTFMIFSLVLVIVIIVI